MSPSAQWSLHVAVLVKRQHVGLFACPWTCPGYGRRDRSHRGSASGSSAGRPLPEHRRGRSGHPCSRRPPDRQNCQVRMQVHCGAMLWKNTLGRVLSSVRVGVNLSSTVCPYQTPMVRTACRTCCSTCRQAALVEAWRKRTLLFAGVRSPYKSCRWVARKRTQERGTEQRRGRTAVLRTLVRADLHRVVVHGVDRHVVLRAGLEVQNLCNRRNRRPRAGQSANRTCSRQRPGSSESPGSSSPGTASMT